eukprot:SAG25_NODE_431_length_8120_cov_2.274529_13_plen_75_part_00
MAGSRLLEAIRGGMWRRRESSVCVCVSGFISRYDTELAEYDYCSDGGSGSGGGRMISAAAAAAAAVTPVSSSRQ